MVDYLNNIDKFECVLGYINNNFKISILNLRDTKTQIKLHLLPIIS